MYLLLRECLLHMLLQCKMIHRRVAYLRASAVKRGGKAKLFCKKETVPWPMGCALNSTHVTYFSLFFLLYLLVLFCCISESLGLGCPDLLLRGI